MPVPILITDLSATAASNAPAGSDSPSSLDDIQRAHGAFIAQLRDGQPVSVKDLAFGAVGDGVTDDTAAIQAAITYAAGVGCALYFPRGIYLITAPISVSLNGDVPLILRGDGSSGASELRMNTGGNGLNITLLGNWWQGLSGVNSTGLRVADMSFTTTNANLGTGINIVGACVAGRPSPQIIFTDCDFKAATSTSQYWATAVGILDAGEAWFNGCRFLIGGSGNITGTGLSIDGTAQANSPVHFYLDNCDFTYGGTQILIGDFVEGVYITQCNIIAGVVGLYWHPSQGESGLHIMGGHFSCSTTCIDLDNVFDIEVIGALLYRGALGSTFNAILLNTTGRFTIVGNVFVGLNDATLPETGVQVQSSVNTEKYGGVVRSNSFHSFASRAVWLGANANYVGVGSNTYRECATKVLNQQANFNNHVEGATFSGNKTFALAGGAAAEYINIPIPTGIFKAKPGGGIITGCGSSNSLVGSYDYDAAGSTATNAQVTLRLLGGGLISAATNRVSFSFFEDTDTSI